MRRLIAWFDSLPLSREGLFWLMIALAMMVTGLVKGINLVTLLACWIVALTLLNFWWAWRQLRRLDARFALPELAFAGTPFHWSVRLSNHGAKPGQHVGVRVDDIGAGWFIAQAPPNATLALDAVSTLPRRGLYLWDKLRLTSGYPVGLVQLSNRMPAQGELIIAPKLGRLQRGLFRQWLSRHCHGLGPVRAAPHRHPAAQTEFHGLRGFRPGDSPRHIHWRTTARRGELMVREFEDWPNDNLILLVDPWRPMRAAPGADPLLERLLSLAATIIWEWCRQKGDDLILGVATPTPTIHSGPTGNALAVDALKSLAQIEGSAADCFPALLEHLTVVRLPAAPVVILTCRPEPITEQVRALLHHEAAQIDVAAGEEGDFFEET